MGINGRHFGGRKKVLGTSRAAVSKVAREKSEKQSEVCSEGKGNRTESSKTTNVGLDLGAEVVRYRLGKGKGGCCFP